MKTLQQLRLLPSDGLRFGFWRSLLVSLLTGLVLSSIVILVSEEDSFSTRLGLCFALSLPGWLAPLVWNRRAVALGAPGFWTVWGRFLKRLGLAAVALIALISLAFAIEGIRAAWAWQEVEAHLKQRGEPLTFEDLVGPRVPDAQNFARHPLMDGLLSHTATNDAKGRPTFQWTGQRKIAELQEALRFPEPRSDEPKGGNRLRRTGPDLEALASLLKSGTHREKRTVYDPGRTEPRETNDLVHLPIPPAGMPTAQAVLYAFEGRRAVLDQVTEATRRPRAQYDLRYADGPFALLPHLAIHKSIAMKLRTRSAARVAAGDTAGAAEDIDTLLRLAELTGEDPTLIGYLVRVAIQSIAFSAFWDGTAQHAWSDAQLAAFQQRFEGLKQRDSLVKAFRGERLFGKTTFELMREGRLDPDTLGAMESDESGNSIGWGLVPRAWLLQNQAYHSKVLDQVVGALQRCDPERGIAAKGSIWETERVEQTVFNTAGRRFHPYRIFTHLLLPGLAKVHAKADRSLTTSRLAITVAGLERHRLATGRYPKSLDDLVPKWVPTVPLDPMDGQPLRYRLNADGTFTVYGIGPNQTDDNGVFESKQGQDLDWVWPPNHPTEERRLF
ncbi:MAG: hypothetical protein RLZZ582_637 [Verrucomicrobiota bacterium]|jgi:hypothetical protein